jgi:hypothetical protein
MIFNQGATLKIGSLEFVYPDFHMEWNYKVENDNSPSVLEIAIFNLSDTNINSMKINDKSVFQFGYNEDIWMERIWYLHQVNMQYILSKKKEENLYRFSSF